MTSNHYPSKSHFNTLIRNNHSEIHGSNCHCIGDPTSVEMNNIRSDVSKKQKNSEINRQERYLLRQKLALSELENRKLHENMMKYQEILEQLQKTNMELVQIAKIEQRKHKEDLTHLTKSQKGNFNSTRKQLQLRNAIRSQQLEGQYIVSFKKLNNLGQQVSQEKRKSGYQSTYKKPGISMSFQNSNKRQPVYQSNQKINPQQISKSINLQSKHQKQQKLQLQQAYLRIQQLQHALKYKSQDKNNNISSILSENQLLKLKLKNIQQDIVSYQKSIKHYQVSINQLQTLINDLKQKQLSGSNHQIQSISINTQNEQLKKELKLILNEFKAQRNVNDLLQQQIEIQKRNNYKLLEQNKNLRVIADEIDRQKQINSVLTEKLKAQTAQLNDLLAKQSESNFLLKELYQIKNMLQSINLSQIQQEHKRILLENKSKITQLTQQVSILNVHLQRYKQQILSLQEKLASHIADKQLIIVSLKGTQQQNSILQHQVKDLENSIEKYLETDVVRPFIKTTVTNQRQESIETNTVYFTNMRKSIKQIVSRLSAVQKRIIENNE